MLILPVGPAIAAIGPAPVADDDMRSQDKAEIVVTGSVALQSNSVTRLTLSPRETPQSATIAGRKRIDDFALNNVNDLRAPAGQG